MALSGTFTQGFTNNGAFRLRLEWSATQNVNGNYSTVSTNLYIDSLQSWASVYDGTSSACNININGNNKSFSNTSTVGAYESKWLGSHSATIYHNSDGSKWFEISTSHNFDITWNGAYVGTVNLYGSAWLNTIPRATTPALSNYNPIMGENITIYLPRASDSFTHYVFHDFYAGTWTKINTTAVGTSLSWTVPLKEYAQRMQNAVTGGGRIQVDTYNGGTFIGSKIVNFTATVPASVVPTISAGQVTHAETVAGLATKFANYVQGKSKIRATVAGTGAMIDGVSVSTITGYRIQMNGQTYNTNDATSFELVNAGAQDIIYTVTDSRGRTASRTVSISPLAYKPPILSVLSASRCEADGTPNDEGEYAKVTIGATLSALNNLNNKIFTLSKKPVTSEIWTNQNVSSGTYTIATTVIISGISGNNAWDIKFTVQDYFNTGDTISKTIQLSTAFTLIDYFKGGKGLAFGKVAEKEGFENNLKTWFTGGIEAIPLPSGDGSLVYWQTVKGGYYYATLGLVNGQPTPSGLIQVIRLGTDFSALWYDTTSQKVYRLYGSVTTINGWTLISGAPVTFAPTLLNGWVNHGDGFAPVKYWKGPDNMVHITGLIKNGVTADNTIIFTLPIGYRPGAKELFTVTQNNVIGRIDIDHKGNVLVKKAGAGFTSLYDISFLAEN